MLPAAQTFVRLVSSELRATDASAQFNSIVGTDVASVNAMSDAKQLGALVARWNTYAAQHPPLARMAFYDRGVRSEISLGHRGTGTVWP